MLGYDHVVEIGTTKVHSIAPAALQLLRSRPPQPFFLSIGFFETHREFFEPSSVRDALYGAPPAHLPDTAETRADMAAFKASARSLDQGVGAVLHGLDEPGLADDTLVVLTTDHGLPFPGAKATLSDRGLGVMLIIRGPGGFHGGHVTDALTSHVDIYPTLLELAGAPVPPAHARQVAAAAGAPAGRRGPRRAVRRADLPRRVRPPTRDPHRPAQADPALRRPPRAGAARTSTTRPRSRCWSRPAGEPQPRPRVELYDLIMDPGEMRNLADVPEFAGLRDQLDRRLHAWMGETDDPLLDGPVPVPDGALVNDPAGLSASEPYLEAVG